MEKIIIVGAGGFGREVKMLIDQINHNQKKYELIGFVDERYYN
jgi:mannose/fructose-specific phosphotransferase system component IIA